MNEKNRKRKREIGSVCISKYERMRTFIIIASIQTLKIASL